MRPANIVTAISDILAGAAIASWSFGTFDLLSLLLLVVATVGLYGGGVVFNDVFDAALDKHERPERPIPSGLILIREAATLGIILMCLGVSAAALVSFFAGGIALSIAVFALLYDKWGKHHSFFGPLNMGLCRGLNLLLGMSLLPGTINDYGYLAIIPLVYIMAITMISRGEVHGGKTITLKIAFILYVMVIISILYLSWYNGFMLYVLFLIALFAFLIFPALMRAIREPIGRNIGKAVKAGVISLIVMNASWAAAFGSIYVALFTLALLPLSILLAKIFAVT